MRYLLILLAATLYGQPQTTVPPSMLRESSALEGPPSEIRLYAVDLKGKLFRVRTGAGLSLRFTPEGGVLEAAPVAAPPLQRLVRRVLARDVAGNYVVSATAAIYRNGMLMTAGADYDHNGAGVLPKSDWAGDIVVALSLEAAEVIASAETGNPTLAEPSQIRNWAQVRNPGSVGTSAAIRQISMPSAWDFWERAAKAPHYDQYRVAVVDTQRFPILITCGKAGAGCASRFPLWFNSPRR